MCWTKKFQPLNECPQPVILYNRVVVYICIERSIVAQVTPVQAVPTFFALFFVFNLQYTTNLIYGRLNLTLIRANSRAILSRLYV